MPRIAWFSAVSKSLPLKSSHYTSEVLRHVSERNLDWEIELFVDDEDLRDCGETSLHGFPLAHFLRASYRDNQNPFDYCIYQFEDHPRSSFVQTAVNLMPGISFFHDLNLSRLEYSRVEHSSTGAALNDKIEETYGDDAVKLGDLQARGWSIEVFDKAYPQGEEELRASAVIAVSNVRAVQELEARDMKIPISMTAIPNAESKQGRKTDATVLRTALGLDRKTPLICFAAEQLLEDRASITLEAFVALRKRLSQKPLQPANWSSEPQLRWLVADTEMADRAELLLQSFFAEHEEARDSISVVRSESFEHYQQVLSVADIFVGLKFDALRGRSVALNASLSFGIPCIVSDFGPSAEIPHSAAAHISVGRGERELLARTLEELLRRRPLREYYASGALAYATLISDSGSVTADLEQLMKEHEIRLKELSRLARDRYEKRERDLVRMVEQGRGNDPVMQSIGVSGQTEQYAAIRDFEWEPTIARGLVR